MTNNLTIGLLLTLATSHLHAATLETRNGSLRLEVESKVSGRAQLFRLKEAKFEDRASSSQGKHEGESSALICDRLCRTRDASQRQLPTDHDYAVSTREYQARKTLVANKIGLKSKKLTSIALSWLTLRDFHEVSRAGSPKRQTDQSSPKPAPAVASPVFEKRKKQRQPQKQPHSFAGIDRSLHIRWRATETKSPRNTAA
jgi:hypothetical protein